MSQVTLANTKRATVRANGGTITIQPTIGKGPKGDKGDTGATGPGGSDSGVAGYLNDDASETRAAADKAYARGLSVKTKGATGDGDTDDTDAIHAARDAAAAFGAEVYFPPGTYVTSGLTANVAGQRWLLDDDAIIKKDATATHAVSITADDVSVSRGSVDMTALATNAAVFVEEGVARAVVDGVHITGGANGVRIKDSTGTVSHHNVVRNCHIENTASHGVFLNWEVEDTAVLNCTIENTTGNGVWAGNSSVRTRVQGNTLATIGRIGVEIYGGSDDSFVADNLISDSTLMGISIDSSDRTKVARNQLLTVSGTYGVELARSNKCIVESNYIEDAGTYAIIQTNSSSGTTDDNAIIGNTIVTPGSYGIMADGAAGGSKRTRVIGNTIIDHGASANAIATQTGIGCADWLVSDNLIVYTITGRTAINLNAPNCTIVGNHLVYDAAITSVGGSAINVPSTALDNVVQGNQIHGNAKCNKGIVIASAVTGAMIVGNRITGTQQDVINNASSSATNLISDNVGTATAGGGFTLGSAVGGGNKMTSTSYAQYMGPSRFEGNIGFFSTTPIARTAAYTQTYSTASRTHAAYTSDTESVAYTGATDGEAKLADLNALRVAYENLRVAYESSSKVLNQVIDDLQAYGLLQ